MFPRRPHSFYVFLVFSVTILCICSCAEQTIIIPQRQRIVIMRPNVPLYQHPQRRWVEFLRRGDTLTSFATQIVSDESGEQRYFFVKRYDGEIASVKSDFGKSAETEYELLTRFCDTDFLMPPETDSIAWERAKRYVERYAPNPIERLTPTLIQTGKRLRTDAPTDFTIRRTFGAEGTRYAVRVNASDTVRQARRCAFFVQTGKGEEEFCVVDSLAR
ncbi:MAG: hypothetical protein MUF71_10265 [Candidatus Kapabacteria bacterium]|nr:hypothetical protein [Candidatus Kapabacteria bacterium]